MARSAARRRNAPPPSVKDLVRSRSGTTLDGLVMVAVGLGAGLGFGYSPDARRWVLESLGYGLIPAALWVTVAVIVLRYHRRAMVRFWRRWISAAAFVATAMWTLSFFHAGDGTLAEIGLGGGHQESSRSPVRPPVQRPPWPGRPDQCRSGSE